MIAGALLSVATGIGLAAACGFRVFVPLLVLGLAARGGLVPLTSGFAWIAGAPALLALGIATLLEVAAYKVPWLDHALDLLATPAAILAGTMAAASVTGDLPPVVRFAVAVVGGGGAAGIVQGTTVLLRLKSGLATAGLANPLLAAGELFSALVTSALALLLPLLALLLLIAGCGFIFHRFGRIVFGRQAPPRQGGAS